MAALDPAFAAAEKEFARLHEEYADGGLSCEEMDAALKDLIVEHDGRYWMLGANSAKWYVNDGSRWSESDPPQARPPEGMAAPSPLEPGRGFHGHEGAVLSVAISADQRLAASGGVDGTIRVWDIDTWSQRDCLEIGAPVSFVRFLPSGAHVAYQAGSIRYVAVVDLGTKQHTGLLRDHSWGLGPAEPHLSFDGLVLVSSGTRAVHVWDLRSGQEALRLPALSTPSAVAVSRDGVTAAAGGESGVIQIWHVPSGSERASFAVGGSCTGLSFSHDGERLASAGSSVVVWAPGGGAETVGSLGATCLAWLPRRGGLVTAGDSVVHLWDLDPVAEVAWSATLPADITTVVCAADGTWALTGHTNGTVAHWALPPC